MQRLHAKLPVDRFQSAQEAAELLTQCLAHVTQPTLHPLPKSVASSPKRLSVRLQILSVLAIMAVVIVFAVMNRTGSTPEEISSAPSTATSPSAVASVVEPPKEPVKSNDRAITETPDVSPFDSTKLDDWDDQLDPVLQDVELKLSEVLQTD